MKAVRPVIASNEVPYIQIRFVGSNSTLGEGEGKNDVILNLSDNGV